MSCNDINDTFADFQRYIDIEQDFREELLVVVKELEQKARELLTLLQTIHHVDGLANLPGLCDAATTKFADVKLKYEELASKLPKDQYYRFNDHWRFVTQRLCFLAALLCYLRSETLITRQDCCALLGVHVDRANGFHVDIDDFLTGLLQLASELSRLAVNAVTAGDYSRPVRIARFITDLDLGFRLLNLKNDSLRKRYDGLKYDLRKVEEVVYDITIRGLKPAELHSHTTTDDQSQLSEQQKETQTNALMPVD